MPLPLFVLTGGPGSGKTTLLEALGAQGLCTSPETGRAILQEQHALGGGPLDPTLFAERMLARDIEAYRRGLTCEGPVFFDRGIPDVIGYLRLMALPVPGHMEEAARILRYNRMVFIAPPWGAIFGQDAERAQTFGEAEATHARMMEVYTEYGYGLVPLPLVPVEERVRFLLGCIRP